MFPGQSWISKLFHNENTHNTQPEVLKSKFISKRENRKSTQWSTEKNILWIINDKTLKYILPTTHFATVEPSIEIKYEDVSDML